MEEQNKQMADGDLAKMPCSTQWVRQEGGVIHNGQPKRITVIEYKEKGLNGLGNVGRSVDKSEENSPYNLH